MVFVNRKVTDVHTWEEKVDNAILRVSCILILLAGSVWAQGNRLDNQDVIDMVKVGLSDDVVIEKIRTAPETSFDTSLEALKALKAAKVSDAVIRIMVNPKAPASMDRAMVTSTASPAVPGFPSNATVAYRRSGGSFTALEQCPAPSTKSAGMGVGILTGGMAGIKAKSVYRGAEAPLRIEERRPTFYVRSNSGRGIILVRLEKKGDRRELQVLSDNFGSQTGLREKDRVEATVAPIADGFISVAPAKDLPNGEYLITFDEYGAVSFDFGIVAPK